MNFKEFYRIYERAFHGSAAKIKGKFSYDKIGSGHGAQAFGYGFYFAESRSVASSYVANSYKASYRYKGKDANYWYSLYADRGDYGKAEIWENIMLHKNRENIHAMLKDSEASSDDFEYLDSLPKNLFAPSAGGLYQVELNTTVNELLNWRKPFNEQSDFVKDKLNSIKDLIQNGYEYKYTSPFNLEELTGEYLYHSIQESFSIPVEVGGLKNSKYDINFRKDANASNLLRSLGIKGNIYSTVSNSNDNNIVMFSPDDISILEEL